MGRKNTYPEVQIVQDENNNLNSNYKPDCSKYIIN